MPLVFRFLKLFQPVSRHLSKRGGRWLLALTALTAFLWACYFVESGRVFDGPAYAESTIPFSVALLHGLFASLQFLVLNKDLPQALTLSPANPLDWLTWGLFLMQLLLPLIAAFSVIAAIFREQILASLLRRGGSRLKEHHVILGLGGIGKAILDTSLERKTAVSAVDRDGQDRFEGDNPLTVILASDAAAKGDEQKALLQHLGCASARQIFLVLPDQQANLLLLKGLQESSSKATIHVRANTESLYRLFADWLSLDNCRNMDVRPFNPYQIAARGIVNLHSPDLYAPTDREGEIAQKIMIVGASELAIALLLRFARIGIYSPKGKLNIIWAGNGTAQAFAALQQHYPALAQRPDLHCWSRTGFGAGYLDEFLPPVEILVHEGVAAEYCNKIRTQPSAVYVCEPDEIDGYAAARDLQAALGGRNMSSEPIQRRILVATSGKMPNLRSTTENRSPSGMDVLEYARYGIEELNIDRFFAETLLEDKADQVAKKYVAVYEGKGVIGEEEWRDLTFFEKESNRDLADHLAIKARYAGLDWKKIKEKIFDGEHVTIDEAEQGFNSFAAELITMEQRRYRAFMFLMNFRHGCSRDECIPMAGDEWGKWTSGDHKRAIKSLDRVLRLNPTLLEKELPEEESNKDYNINKVSLQVLGLSVDEAEQASGRQ